MRFEALLLLLLIAAAGCTNGDCRETCWAAEYDGFLPSTLGEGSSPVERVSSCEARCEGSSNEVKGTIRSVLCPTPDCGQVSMHCSAGLDDSDCAKARDQAFKDTWCGGDPAETTKAALARDRLETLLPLSAGRLRVVAQQNAATPTQECRVGRDGTTSPALSDDFCTKLGAYELDFLIDGQPFSKVSSCSDAGLVGAQTNPLRVGLHSLAVEIHRFTSSDGLPGCIHFDGGAIALGANEDQRAAVQLPPLENLTTPGVYQLCAGAAACEDLPPECEGRSAAALLDASNRIGQRTQLVTERIIDGCKAVATHLGAGGSEISENATWQTQLAWCQRAIQLRMIRTDLIFGHGSRLCEYGLSKSAGCSAACAATPQCELTLNDPLARCDSGVLAGSCAGQCVGDCVWDQPVPCDGACFGACSGQCDGATILDASCGGTCGGQCVGECRYAPTDALTCGGTCYGQCSASFLSSFCEAAPGPPTPQCGACSTCQDICQARGELETMCEGRKVRVLGGMDGDDRAALADAAGVVLGSLDEVEAVIAAAEALQKLESDLEALGGSVAACAALQQSDLAAALAQAKQVRDAAKGTEPFL